MSKRYWNNRYKTRLWSGRGSREPYSSIKRKIVQKYVELYKVESILDLGCGDLYWMKDVDIDSYIGIDISPLVLRQVKKLKPNWDFLCMDVSNAHVYIPSDLVLCLDVLFHLPTLKQYQTALANIISNMKKIALVTAITKPTPHLYFFEQLPKSLERFGIQCKALAPVDVQFLYLVKP